MTSSQELCRLVEEPGRFVVSPSEWKRQLQWPSIDMSASTRCDATELTTGLESPRADVRPAGRRAGSIPQWGHALVALVITAVCAAYILPFVDRGWIPHDEGLIAHSAERVLDGQIPHRDFQDAYTGGLTYLHALAFKTLGLKLSSLRIVLLCAYLLLPPAVYFIAIRHADWWMSVLTVGACVTWSLPNYFASLPSWYVLVAAILGTAAMIAYGETNRWGWLVASGVCGGLAILMKVVGLYYVAAGLLFLMFREQQRSADAGGGPGSCERSPAFVAFTALVSSTLVGMLLLLLRRDLRPSEIYVFVVPTVLLCGFLVSNEWHVGRGPFWTRLGRLAGNGVWFVCGVLIPLILFVIPFAWQHSLADLYMGVLVLPRIRLETAKEAWQSWLSFIPALLPAALVFPLLCGLPKGKLWPRPVMFVAAALILLLLAFYTSPISFDILFFALRGLLPLLVLGACIVLLRRGSAEWTSARRESLFLLAAMASLLFLIQYPQAYLIYFCYCAPPVLLLLHAVTLPQSGRGGWVRVVLMGSLLIFGITRLNSVYGLTKFNYVGHFQYDLELERGGLKVDENWKREYEAVVSAIRRQSNPGDYIYAAPDCPEIYFLTNRRNPTPTMFDFFDDQTDREQRILQLLDDKRVGLVVLNEHPYFSKTISREMEARLLQRFPQRQKLGRFTIARREAPDVPAVAASAQPAAAGRQAQVAGQ